MSGNAIHALALANMKFLDFDEMSVLLPASTEAESKASAKFNKLLERANGKEDIGRLEKLVADGTLKTSEIRFEGVAIGVIWYRIEDCRLIVDTLVSIGSNAKKNLSIIVNAIKQLGNSFGCISIEGCTARKGLLEQYLSMGFFPIGVVCRLNL